MVERDWRERNVAFISLICHFSNRSPALPLSSYPRIFPRPLLGGTFQIATSNHSPNFDSLRQQKEIILSTLQNETFWQKNYLQIRGGSLVAYAGGHLLSCDDGKIDGEIFVPNIWWETGCILLWWEKYQRLIQSGMIGTHWQSCQIKPTILCVACARRILTLCRTRPRMLAFFVVGRLWPLRSNEPVED